MGSILEEVAQGRATIVPWTVDRYHRAIASGLLAEDASLELIDGFIVRKDRATAGDDPMTVGDRHRVTVLRLARLAPAFEPLGSFLQTQQPITLPPLNEPEPDAAVVRGRIDDYLDRPPSAADVSCVVEVSDSSLSRDLGPKLAAYALAGIPQYIVIDLVHGRVLVHTRPVGEAYSEISTIGPGDTLQVTAGPTAVPVAASHLLP